MIKYFFKGRALPPLPPKALKFATDHKSTVFVQDRKAKLETYLSALLLDPHYAELEHFKAFMGFPGQVRIFIVVANDLVLMSLYTCALMLIL